MKYISLFVVSLFYSFSSFANSSYNESLKQYLASQGIPNLDEGHMSEDQRAEFNAILHAFPEIESILEIGLNGGNSAHNFFQNCPNLKKFVSFDIGSHRYIQHVVNFFKINYPNQFHYVKGDSAKTVHQYHRNEPNMAFDLIYIDGAHDYDHCYLDIINCRSLASEATRVWIDDYNYDAIFAAVQECVQRKILAVDAIHESNGKEGYRCWIEAHYLNKAESQSSHRHRRRR